MGAVAKPSSTTPPSPREKIAQLLRDERSAREALESCSVPGQPPQPTNLAQPRRSSKEDECAA
ncbi:hypothetical protein B0T16DRAFT_416833 [Cercophora newfieldiana]|uniref:Uncharacterized protein n=1 Tax=Cercophora newfieldiana TaxID=92897 RepID=A0AA39Y0U1_9PEZI|nr:hypothetical protein B0T16DRAFT_416833 [Cercophora newfieldiana]